MCKISRPSFINGLTLSEALYAEAVQPLLAAHFPNLNYSAALLGAGSDVLGFDTEQSTDHDWGPRLTLFLAEDDYTAQRDAIDKLLRQRLPREIRGYSTHFGRNDDDTGVMATAPDGEINHRIKLYVPRYYFAHFLGCDPTAEMSAADWVSIPQYNLLMLTSGGVFHDGLKQLAPMRTRLAYYPDDVWRYLLAAQWRRISQEEAFMGRCAQVGDELGSRLVAARLVNDLMGLAFLMSRRYAPYRKWFGSAFAQLDCAADLAALFEQTLAADTWQAREKPLVAAYEYMARWHNRLGVTDTVSAETTAYYTRPFQVIFANRFYDALRTTIKREDVLALPPFLGGYDQFVDSTDALRHLKRLKTIYTID